MTTRGGGGPLNLANVDAHGVARRGDTDVMSLLLDTGLDPNLLDTRGFSLLMIAAYSNQPAMVRLLAERGADPNLPDPMGNTPLMGTGFKGYVEVARTLLAAGADPSITNRDGETALDFAEKFEHTTLIEVLTGADRGKA
ncbi:MAG: ankyrin repeat domain-containing protein [Thioalkalivibrio sp.]|nr:ankyrin repeat domain-containing protein [Thioalkalivibrio sp.]